MRTKEQGLLTVADAFMVANLEMELRQAAHGGLALASKDCLACRTVAAALGEWLGAHTADEQELDELEATCKEAP